MNIVFRTNCNGTLGHLARCLHLGRSLQAKGHAVHFLLDHAPAVNIEWLVDISWSALYDHEQSFTTEQADATLCLKLLAQRQPSLVILDDYRLALSWESLIRKNGHMLLAIDDIGRDHVADILLEPRLVEPTDDRLFPDSCLWLQGPRYTLLDPAYAQLAEKTESGITRIVMSLGGGGDMQIIHDCAKSILEEYDNVSITSSRKKLLLMPVIGPLAVHAELIQDLVSQFPGSIAPIVQPGNLCSYFQQADLFIGAAGTSVYETSACQLPAITFSLSSNQKSDVSLLEPLGHFFHINAFSPTDSKALGKLVITMIEHYPRLRSLRQRATDPVDGRGVGRVVTLIQTRLSCGTKPERIEQQKLETEAQRLTSSAPPAYTESQQAFQIRACDDSDINRYLAARNLAENRGNMTTDLPIKPLDHYRWWFNTRRQSYCMESNGVAKLYIWHEVVHNCNQDMLVGGWFVATKQTDITCVMSALQWQLEHTDEAFPGKPWIAVIKKTNQFVFKMNERAGFKQATEGTDWYQSIQQYFPTAEPESFFYVYRDGVVAEQVTG